ncbi:MAG: VOC family protein [Chitinophagaceae bacterium]|nr:VOC family protein [Chitinophagaceae bacterium]
MKAIICNLIWLLFVVTSFAQENGFKFSADHVALSVKDVNRSAEFYITVLRLPEITNRSKIEGIRWFVLGDGRELHLISVIKENVTINKAVHVGLSSAKFDEFVKHLTANKISYSDWPGKANTINIRADGIKQVFFQDPDGYWIEVNSLKK